MKEQLYEQKSSLLTVKYLPDNQVSIENPPRFSWMPANEENKWYTLEISSNKNFAPEDTTVYKDLPYNFFVPDKCFQPGEYFWRYGLQQQDGVLYASTRRFVLEETSVKMPLPFYKTRFEKAFSGHPRLWLPGQKLEQFKAALKKDPDHCNFSRFFENCVKPRLGKPVVTEPAPYPNNKRVIALWRQNYMDCQQALNHVRFLSVAGVLLEDSSIIQQGVEALLAVAQWNPEGPTGRDYNDECAFRVAEALAWGYDWLYNSLTAKQKSDVRKVLLQRTGQVAQHAMVSSKIHYSLYDSHAVRSLSSVLMPACIAMLGEEAEAEPWLNYTVDYLGALYTPWGGADGGWAEGGLYWTTGMAYLTSALDLLKNYAGIDLFKRPFFQSTGSFPLYCFPHDTYRASFCDQSNLGEKPILKTAFNAREFAGVTQNGEYQWYFEEIAKRESYNDTKFFNIGWWDFHFDELVYLSNYAQVKPVAPQKGRAVKWFKDIGWVALHSNMQDESEHIFMLTKSSPYGSVSHSHADQNALLLFAFGEPLLIESGYYIGFNSTMHRNWRKQTKSTNCLLFNKQGQYGGMDKALQLAATGQVISVEETDTYVHVIENATNAYKQNVPYLTDFTREIYFVNNAYFIVVDSVEMEQAGQVDFLLHTLFEPQFIENRLQVNGEKAKMTCEFIYVSSGIKSSTIDDVFDGVAKEETEGLAKNWNFTLTTGKAKKHTLVTCIHPKKIENGGNVGVIKDDQGHDVYFYFNHDGQTFTICIDGDKRY